MNLKVTSFQIADSIDIKPFRSSFYAPVHYGDTDELFYQVDKLKYLYVLNTASFVFWVIHEDEMATFFQIIEPFCKNLFEQRLSDEFDIETDAPAINYGYNKIEIPSPDTDELRLIMLNVSQSVALDYYNQQTNSLLEETNSHTQLLERRGKINMGGVKLKKIYRTHVESEKQDLCQPLYIRFSRRDLGK